MKLQYWNEESNFGDCLNPWLWNKALPEGFLNDDDSTVFVGIGTILGHPTVENEMRTKVVFSSGVGYGKTPVLDDKWKIYSVRGPLTARALGLDETKAITDGALLIRKYVVHQQKQTSYKYGLMPHHYSAGNGWKTLCKESGILYIDPALSPDEVFNKLFQCEILLAEAMHGAIVADALRIPWIPFKSNPDILGFKWQDWCMSVGLFYDPEIIWRHGDFNYTPSAMNIKMPVNLLRRSASLVISRSHLKHILLKARPMLSSEATLNRLQERLEATLDELITDWRQGRFSLPEQTLTD